MSSGRVEDETRVKFGWSVGESLTWYVVCSIRALTAHPLGKVPVSLHTNTRSGPVVVAYEMGAPGHLNRMLPVVDGLVRAGCTVHVYTARSLASLPQRLGAIPHAIDALEAPNQLDRATTPSTLRWVTFAGRHAHTLADEAAALGADLIVHDGLAPVGAAVAARLDIPRVAVVAGHAQPPHRFLETARRDFTVHCSEEALRAASVLHDDYGLPGTHPLELLYTLSPWLNLYGEPSEFLDPADWPALEPLAFFGAVIPTRPTSEVAGWPRQPGRVRVVASVGSVCWRAFPTEARATLTAVAEAVAGMDNVDALLSAGGDDVTHYPRPGSNVTVVPYIDQWSALAHASLFITHHGLNSTHEAIWHQVPMLSAPFFHDQPGLARRCQAMGLAIPLAEPRLTVPTVAQVRDALQQAMAEGPRMLERLAEAKAWEQRVIDQRPAVIARILDLT